MEHPDVTMSDSESDDGLLAYGIPHPPTLDDSLRFNDNSVGPPDWRQHAKYFGARLNPDKQSYEARCINFADLSGQGRYFENDWPIECQLGAPDDNPDGWDPLIQKWGLKLLNAAGFINLDKVDDSVSYMSPYGKWAPEREKYDLSADRVHPAFRFEMWRNTDYLDYQAIMPALLLASAFLDDPKTLCLFHAISAPPSQMISFRDPKLGFCMRAQIPDTLTEIEQKAVYEKMVAMREYTTFGWATDADLIRFNALAFTLIRSDSQGDYIPATGPFTRQSDIHMSSHIIHALSLQPSKDPRGFDTVFAEKILDAANVPDNRRPDHFDLISSQMRTVFIFATILLHEFVHAFSYAYFTRPITEPPQPTEPWLAGNRSNELGFAAQNFLFGGVTRSNRLIRPPMEAMEVKKQAYVAPFGIWFAEKWDLWAVTSEAEQVLEEGKAAEYAQARVLYPMAQQQIERLYTRKLWMEKVSRYGLEALKLTKIPEWAARVVPGAEGPRLA